MVGILSRLLIAFSQYNKTILHKDACHVYTKVGLKCQSPVGHDGSILVAKGGLMAILMVFD